MSIFTFKLRNRFIKPYTTGYLPTQDGHQIFYQEVGNPKGEPVIVFHGGPGSQCYSFFACTFNLKKNELSCLINVDVANLNSISHSIKILHKIQSMTLWNNG